MNDKNITQLWVWVSDEGGNRALEVFRLDPPLKNPIGDIKIEMYAFYETDEKGINQLYFVKEKDML